MYKRFYTPYGGARPQRIDYQRISAIATQHLDRIITRAINRSCNADVMSRP